MRGQFETVVVSLVMLIVALAWAQIVAARPISPAPTSIPPGTIITRQNWQLYRQFMSDGLAALFEGKQFWHMPAELRIEVGPTISIRLPKRYLDDTARYSSQVRLMKTPIGGYVPIGDVAGISFPHPLEGDPALRGQRIFWNSYYRYQPRVQWAPTFTYTLDKFGNMTQASEVKSVFSQLAFLSDVGYTQTAEESGGYY